MKHLMCALGLSLLLAASAAAQPPRGFYAWWDSPVVRDLNLTPRQMQNIRETVREYRNKLIDERAAVQKAEAEVGDLFNDDRFDEKRTGEAVERLAAARAELTRTFTLMAMKLRAQISGEQWRMLQSRRPRVALQPGDTAAPGAPPQAAPGLRPRVQRRPLP